MNVCVTDNIIEVKGRVACEISSADELVLTELIFTGVLNDLNGTAITTITFFFFFITIINGFDCRLTVWLCRVLSCLQWSKSCR